AGHLARSTARARPRCRASRRPFRSPRTPRTPRGRARPCRLPGRARTRRLLRLRARSPERAALPSRIVSSSHCPLLTELVRARALLGVALDVEHDVVLAGVDVDLDLLRFPGVIAPHARHVLARRDAAEVELVIAFDGHVRRRIDHED